MKDAFRALGGQDVGAAGVGVGASVTSQARTVSFEWFEFAKVNVRGGPKLGIDRVRPTH
jgi:hypothetical protein